MKRRRVKITGIGPVTPLGIGVDIFRAEIFKNRSHIHKSEAFDPLLGEFSVASIPEFHLHRFLERFPGHNGSARHTQFAIVASLLALRDAGVSTQSFLHVPTSLLVTGTSLMDCDGLKRSYEQVLKLGIKGAYTRAVYSTNVASIPATIATALKIHPKMLTIQTSCCSGLDAIGYAAREIADGRSEIALCGGTEAPLYMHPLIELRAAGLMPATAANAEHQCRPFDLWRTTGVIGEGACMFVLEPESTPRKAYAYIDGYAFASDKDSQSCSGMSDAMILAIADARKTVRDVEVLCAWGPGHRQIDAAEAVALRQVFEEHLANIAAYSIKGAIGNPLGAAGAIQVATAAIGLLEQSIPPTVNWEDPDPECNLNLFQRAAPLQHNTTLVNSHGISGTNSTMILSRI